MHPVLNQSTFNHTWEEVCRFFCTLCAKRRHGTGGGSILSMMTA